MIDRLNSNLIQSPLFRDISESGMSPMMMAPMGGFGIGGYYGNRDGLTLRGPLAYDQYGDKKENNKSSKFWKWMIGIGAAIGGIALFRKVPGLKSIGGAIKNFFTGLGSRIPRRTPSP